MDLQVEDENVGSIDLAHSCEHGSRLYVSIKGENLLG